MIKVHDKEFVPYLSKEQIDDKVRDIAGRINHDYKNKKPLFIAVLNGVFMFASDLFKELTVDAEICFIKLSSYEGVSSTGKIKTIIGIDADISNRDIVIIEDIVDTGKTMHELITDLHKHKPSTLRITALLYKTQALENGIKIDYEGYLACDKFLVGYGLDYNGLGRNLREIYELK